MRYFGLVCLLVWLGLFGPYSLGNSGVNELFVKNLLIDGSVLDLRGQAVSDNDLQALSMPMFNQLEKLLLANTPISDDGLSHITKLDLTELDLHNTAVTNAGLAILAHLPLIRLNLSGTQITDAGLKALSQMPLERLNMNNTQVTDNGLLQLKQLPLSTLELTNTAIEGKTLSELPISRLSFLDLTNTPINDSQLDTLALLPIGATISMPGTRVTPAGVAGLVAKRPDLNINLTYPRR